MSKNYENFPAGAIVVEDSRILKIQNPKKDGSPKLAKIIGDFGFHILAKSDQGYLIKINKRLVVDNLDFTATLQAFRKWIRPNTFQGSGDDLENMMSSVLGAAVDLPDNNLIILKNFVGKYEDDRVTFWVFDKKILITHKNKKALAKAELREVPESNILLIDDYYVHITNDEVNPTLIPIYQNPDNYSLDEFLPVWLSQLHNKRLLYILIGWLIAGMYLEIVNRLRQSRFFPFWVLTAQTETGKTALLANCIKVCGTRYIGENFAASVSLFVEVKEFAQVSHLPIWRDEYKNEGYAKTKEGWLRSVYTRAASSRGRADQSVAQYATRATLLLSGEDITEDPALSRRMLKLRLTSRDRISKEEYLKVSEYANENFGKVLPLLITSTFDEEIFTKIFTTQKIQDDTFEKDELMCYAALGAIFGEEVAMEAIATASNSTTEDDEMVKRPVTIEDFFAEVSAMFREKNYFEKGPMGTKPKALDYFMVAKPPARPGTIFARMKDLFPVMKKWRPRSSYEWSNKALSAMLVERYGAKSEPRMCDGVAERLFVFRDVEVIEDSVGDFFQKIQKLSADWDEEHKDDVSPQRPDDDYEETRVSAGQSAHDPDEVPFEF